MWWWLWGCGGPPPAFLAPGDPCAVPGTVCTWLGVPGIAGFDLAPADRRDLLLYLPADLAFAGETAYVTDFNNARIVAVDGDGVAYTASGTGIRGDGTPDGAGCWDGCAAAEVQWSRPTDVAADPSAPGRVWIAGTGTGRIALLEGERVTWWAGAGLGPFPQPPPVDGPRDEATFQAAVSVAPSGDVAYVVDQSAHQLREVSEAGVTTLAGDLVPGYAGDGGALARARLHGPSDAVLASGRLYVVDTGNGVIRVIDLDTRTIDRFAGRYTSIGDVEQLDPATGGLLIADGGSAPGFAGDGGDALDAVFAHPTDLAVGPDGAVYVADTDNHCVRVIRSGRIDTFAGICTVSGSEGDGGPATDALFQRPSGVAVGPDGAVYVADTANHVIRRIVPR
ncbi:MAG: hypothetical protein ABMB14_14445 [Myxococcota bacterium]